MHNKDVGRWLACIAVAMTGCLANAAVAATNTTVDAKAVEDMVYYRAEKGDTVASIAKKHSLKPYELRMMNNKHDGWKIKPGSRVRVHMCPPTYMLSAVAKTNVYSDMLWDFRKTFYALQADSKIRKGLHDIRDMLQEHEELKKRCDCGLLKRLGDNDALMPLVRCLKHVRLGEGEVLDFFLYGDRFATFGRLKVRKEATVMPLRLHPDGTASSAWECLLLRRASDQFFLGWHAGYSKNRIVTDVRRFVEEVDIPFAKEFAWSGIDESGRKRMQKNNFGPIVEMKSGHAVVTYYVFSSFGGLFKRVDRVDMTTGEVSEEMEPKVVVRYCSDIRY